MGVDLGSLVPSDELRLADLAGKIVVVDGNNVLYQFLATIRGPDGTPLMDREGRVTSHLTGLLHRTANIVDAGILPAFVWDGKPPEAKMRVLHERRARREEAAKLAEEARAAGDLVRAKSKAAQSSRLTRDMVESARQLLQWLGIPSVQAPSEGEAQAAAAVREGKAYASASQDYDSVLFGAPRLVRNLTTTGRRKLPGRDQWVDVAPEMVHLDAALAALELTREQLVGVGVLMGTDFHPGIKGVGPKKALAAMKQHGSLEKAAASYGEDPETLLAIARMFLEPDVDPTPKLKWGPVDREKVVDVLCVQHGFAEDRVPGALARYAKLDQPTRQGTLSDFF